MTRHRARPLVALLLILGSAAAFVGSFAVWLDRQALSDAGWTRTSSDLIANRTIRSAIADDAVQELLAAARVPQTLRSVLPDPVAAQALETLRGLGRRLASGILASRTARAVWRTANRQAHRELMAILDRRHHTNARVSLNLTPLLGDLVTALDASAPVRALPGGGQRLLHVGSPRAGELPVLRADQVRPARAAVNAVQGLSVALPLAAVVLFAMAVAIAGGWRSIATRRAGYCLLAVGAVVLVARRLLAPALADALVASSADRRAADAAWMISTSELRDVAVAILIAGAVCVALGMVMAVVWRARAAL